MRCILKQIWNGNIVESDDRDRHKLFVDEFIKLFPNDGKITIDLTSKLGNGLSLVKVTSPIPNVSFNILYQDLRSGDKDGDARKRLQVSKVMLNENEQYFYVAGYKAGDKTILIVYLTGTQDINSSANASSRWIGWEPFYQTYQDGIHLWNKNGISYLGCTEQYMGFMLTALTTRALDNCVTPKALQGEVISPVQKILFGAPGTGKSYRVKEDTLGMNVHRTTFHPDTDYASFVGSYKPTLEDTKVRDSNGRVVLDEFDRKIVYKFVPQIFAKAYCEAWKEWLKPSEQQGRVCLLIEELNRGNCAQIFGDLFQLLDRSRTTGYSEYTIVAEEDFATYLRSELGINFQNYYNNIRANSGVTVIGECTIAEWNASGENKVHLALPPNLSIICTMNTSDQSLFPMDSAFKRRWDWEYVPIEYNLPQSQFTIVIDENCKYSWSEFLKKVNKIVYEETKSEDKQMGNFFVRSDEEYEVSCDQFISKVMYFLWSEICKDSPKARKKIFVTQMSAQDETATPVYEDFVFTDLFSTDENSKTRETLLSGFMLYLGVENIATEVGYIDPLETTGETNKECWEHSLYMDDLINYINQLPSDCDLKKKFPQDYKTHNNEFVLKLDYGGIIRLSRNKDVNSVGYHNKLTLISALKDKYADDIDRNLGIPKSDATKNSDSGWRFNKNSGAVRLTQGYDHSNPNRTEEFEWFVDTATKFYDYFKRCVSEK